MDPRNVPQRGGESLSFLASVASSQFTSLNNVMSTINGLNSNQQPIISSQQHSINAHSAYHSSAGQTFLPTSSSSQSYLPTINTGPITSNTNFMPANIQQYQVTTPTYNNSIGAYPNMAHAASHQQPFVVQPTLQHASLLQHPPVHLGMLKQSDHMQQMTTNSLQQSVHLQHNGGVQQSVPQAPEISNSLSTIPGVLPQQQQELPTSTMAVRIPSMQQCPPSATTKASERLSMSNSNNSSSQTITSSLSHPTTSSENIITSNCNNKGPSVVSSQGNECSEMFNTIREALSVAENNGDVSSSVASNFPEDQNYMVSESTHEFRIFCKFLCCMMYLA